MLVRLQTFSCSTPTYSPLSSQHSFYGVVLLMFMDNQEETLWIFINKIAKDALNSLGSNKSQKSIQWIGRAIGTLSPVMDNFDAINNVSSKQKKLKAKKDIQIVIKELVTAKSFVVVNKGRKHRMFPNQTNLLQSKGKDEWLFSKLPCLTFIHAVSIVYVLYTCIH